ncbi:hypothetical protein B9T19_03760 [Ignatzschineria sp. F8392]|uniref:hypothetical protein n=1 Tax=Ignatzschineria sp. F8392 TaxID=1980117 RepID=UPI000B982494|nr:hypothetical protein [Ignatzschineria sp. F8392]OYQ81788.1 hypothetical protein B9T19_03760 [Ignatzschineria sp. F8392]
MYSQYKEDCCICDSADTHIKIENSPTSVDGINFSYKLVYIHCNECGYEFGNRALTLLNVSNKNEAQKEAIEQGHIFNFIEIDVLPETRPDVKFPEAMYRQIKNHGGQTLMMSLKSATQTILYPNVGSESKDYETTFLRYA